MIKLLNRALLEGDFAFPEELKVARYPSELPERVIQFGEGNFLRGFADWMIHVMNRQGLFNGRVVVIQPLGEAMVKKINEQDGLYTLVLRGIRAGQAVSEEMIITSISRGLSVFSDWEGYLKCAENPKLEFVISNTTEAGIAYSPLDRPEDRPPASFPGKLAVYLYHRFQHFAGDPGKGLVVIPCELIERNGDTLKKIVLQLAKEWGWPGEFCAWIEQHNYFLNSLVDRVVPGYPKDEVEQLTQHLGYVDNLLDIGELFHLWVIEGPVELKERLPFIEAGLNVIWTPDLTPYRTLKVRILNGTHTSCVPVAFLYGLDTVKEMVDHPLLGRYVEEVIAEEIIPSIDLAVPMQEEYTATVLERFRNPYIKHYLLSILLNSTSKFRARVLPSLLEHVQKTGVAPPKLSFSFAALLALYQGKVEGSAMRCHRKDSEFFLRDDFEALNFMQSVWAECDDSPEAVLHLVHKVLANVNLWGRDLTELNGLSKAVAEHLHAIVQEGVGQAILRMLE
ncbi:MAG: tagaturonate reductase [Desulfitobacteriaceae bacterium]